MPATTLITPLLVIIALWCLLLGITRIHTHIKESRSPSATNGTLLPWLSGERKNSKRSLISPNDSHSTLSSRPTSLRLMLSVGWFWLTISWNTSSRLSLRTSTTTRRETLINNKRHHSAFRRLVSEFYSFGSLITFTSFLVVPFYLAWSLYLAISASKDPTANAFESTSASTSTPSSTTFERLIEPTPPVGLLIPGLTIPLRDAPLLFFAGLVAIVWHEAGHALTASWLSDVDITSVAFVLVFAFPGAYVALNADVLEALPSIVAKLQIVTAGIWHNLLLCFMIWINMTYGLVQRDSAIFGALGFIDMNVHGVVVQLIASVSFFRFFVLIQSARQSNYATLSAPAVAPASKRDKSLSTSSFNLPKGSPLSSLLTPGQVLTHLDDVELHDSASYHHWDRYLLIEQSSSTQNSYNNLGYCVDEAVWEVQHSTCCEREHIITSEEMIATPAPSLPDASSSSNKKTTSSGLNHQVCYTNTFRSEKTSKISDEEVSHCFDPSDLPHYSRCTEICKASGQVCIHPSDWENLLRLTVHDIYEDSSKVLFFRGNKRQLWSDVKVGRFRARWTWLQSVPVDFEMFWMYTSSISLSLAMFNLLPLPQLDGSEILDLVLSPQKVLQELPLTRDGKSKIYNDEMYKGHHALVMSRMLARLVRAIQSGLASLLGLGKDESKIGKSKTWVQGTIGILTAMSMMITTYNQFTA